MAITAYTGLPRSGKSYSVVEHVIMPACAARRRVWTNIPLHVDQWDQLYPGHQLTQFSTQDAVNDPQWFDQVLPKGAVLILDEAWKLWPNGLKAVDASLAHKSFLAEHGHRVDELGNSTEVVLVTQDLAQLAAFVRQLVDKTFRSVKLDKIGADNRFSVHVYSGAVTGQKPPKDQIIREIPAQKYKPEIYRLYKSHTMSEAGLAGKEQRSDDRANIWKSGLWRFGAPLALLGAIWGTYHVVSWFKHPGGTKELAPPPGPVAPASPGPVAPPAPGGPQPSRQWRLTGIIFGGSGSYALLGGDNGTRRISLAGCYKDLTGEWSCKLDGEIISRWTGPARGVAESFVANVQPGERSP